MKKMLFLMLILFLVSAASMNAQVNIGSDGSPKKGAVLDLSQSGQKLGLILPTVSLSGATPFQLDGGNDGSNAAGTVVYNTGGALAAGIYVWDGSKWVEAGTTGSVTPPPATGTIVSGAAKDYSAGAKGDVAKEWTTVTNDALKATAYSTIPTGIDAGNLMVSEFVYSSDASVSSKSPGSNNNAYANLNSLSSGITWADAVKKCANLTEGGYSDWYLPNIPELFDLGDAGYLGYSAVGTRTFVYYWSSTEASATAAWYRNFFSNGTVYTSENNKAHTSSSGNTWVARCVRRN